MTQPSGSVAATLALLAVLTVGSCGSEPSSPPSELSTDRGSQPSTTPVPASSRTTTATGPVDTTPISPNPPATPATTVGASGATWIRAESAATPDEALALWFAANSTPYVGDCGNVPTDAELGSWCTSLFRTGDDRQIYRTGQIRSEYATWLLMTRAAGQWTIVDVAPGGDPAAVPWP